LVDLRLLCRLLLRRFVLLSLRRLLGAGLLMAGYSTGDCGRRAGNHGRSGHGAHHARASDASDSSSHHGAVSP